MQSIRVDEEVQIEYAKFTKHRPKFELAFDYLQQNGHGQCIILNASGGFDPNGFDWRGFDIGLLANFEARLSIFYSDFTCNDKGVVQIIEMPPVDKRVLKIAIEELKIVMLNEFKVKNTKT